jgi:BirA family biotin operon repressor/biotin-[acetyl-CoA-carboxylase] ligase
MNSNSLRRVLADLPLGEVRFFASTGSTNDEALAWASQDAPDLSLVVAEEQTAGRGRGERRWTTVSGAALAFSLILRPQAWPGLLPAVYPALGALAVCSALEDLGLAPRIKWPNDILLGGRKACGILAESIWRGETVDRLVLGIGLNVAPQSVPVQGLAFPATCLEAELGAPVDRLDLLRSILAWILQWRQRAKGTEFWGSYRKRMAYLGQAVIVFGAGKAICEGMLEDIDAGGGIRIRDRDGTVHTIHSGELHLRPVV